MPVTADVITTACLATSYVAGQQGTLLASKQIPISDDHPSDRVAGADASLKFVNL